MSLIGKAPFIPTPKKKHALPMKPKGILISAPTAPEILASGEEEPISRSDDNISPSVGAPVGELTEEEQLTLALKPAQDRLWRNGHLEWQASFSIELLKVYASFKLPSHFTCLEFASS